MWVTRCKASEIWALTPLQLLGKPRAHSVRASWHTGMKGETPPFFLSSRGREVMKAPMKQSSWALCLGPKGEMPTTSLPHLPQQVGVGWGPRDGTEDFRQYHGEGGWMWREKISNFQLFCSSIWLILDSLTGVFFVGFSVSKGFCAWSPRRD